MNLPRTLRKNRFSFYWTSEAFFAFAPCFLGASDHLQRGEFLFSCRGWWSHDFHLFSFKALLASEERYITFLSTSQPSNQLLYERSMRPAYSILTLSTGYQRPPQPRIMARSWPLRRLTATTAPMAQDTRARPVNA